ncbi:hypothetical protein K1W69_07235 [Hoeflea sp. WL0058]|uniref:Uncharacterized protein n=1 Tax=Flavimaribacter sediminis TaxID=2865987 RepID=A0AAE2ZP21_9HYPH|nr:hypothetical protein [Flavimaribacter sediminis]MBW8636977.1 hypothetical protein [Flavimaribacter sediminis]
MKMQVEIEDPHAITCWTSYSIYPQSSPHVGLMVETDLELEEENSGYDAGALASLQAAVEDFIAANPNIKFAYYHSILAGK